jgi:hypothetical protein
LGRGGERGEERVVGEKREGKRKRGERESPMHNCHYLVLLST